LLSNTQNLGNAFSEFQLNFAQNSKGLAKVIDEHLLDPTLHDNVIDVHLDIVPDLGAKTLPHGSLEGDSCILEPKGHASVAIAPYWRDEHRLLFILYCHLNLDVTRECVEEAQQVAACRGIHDLIDARRGE
jgi:hypothetical protein